MNEPKEKAHITFKFLLIPCITILFNVFSLRAAIYINEIMPANVSYKFDPTWNFSGWIELYNDGESSVSIWTWRLTDEAGNAWTIPNSSAKIAAKGYYVIWFDHNDLLSTQPPFKLNCEGGTLTLKSGTTVKATATYPASIPNTSYARTTDGASTWSLCNTPTCQGSNNNATFAEERCPTPIFDVPGGLYTTSKAIKCTIPSGYILRYTTNGDEPTETSAQNTTGNFSFTQTTVLRAKLFKTGCIPSECVTHSYIINSRKFTLPVISIVCNPKYLWDDSVGIYTAGVNGVAGNGSGTTRVNWNQDWSRPVNIELMEQGATIPFLEQQAEVCIAGGWSRGWSEKSFQVSAEKKYEGKNRFNYNLFISKPAMRLKSIYLRNSGNDASCKGGGMMKDATLQTLVDGAIDIDHQAYQPYVHYINGTYYGIINLRERNNRQYVESNYGYEKDSVDVFEMSPDYGYVQLTGDKTAFNNLLSLSANAANESTYNQICKLIDIDEFLAYLSLELYISNWDWPQNNVKGFRNRNGGKFRFTLYDLEGGFNYSNNNAFTQFANKEYYTFDDGTYRHIEFVTIVLNLLKNETFKRRFIDYYTLMTGSMFNASRVSNITDSLATNIKSEIGYHQSKWGGNNAVLVTALKSFANARPPYAISTLKSYFGLGTSQNVTLLSDIEGGKLFANGIPIPLNKFSGALFAPVTLKAEAPAGYKFAGWIAEGITSSVTTLLDYSNNNWKYYASGALDGTSWYSTNYSTNTWATGASPIGYRGTNSPNMADLASIVSGLGCTTFYARNTFTLNNPPSAKDTYTINLRIDDGAVVYVNGTEIGRYQMPTGTINYSTSSSTYAAANPETTSMAIPYSLLQKGTNIIAIETHNYGTSSSDLYMNAQVTASIVNQTENIYSTESEIDLPTGSNITLTASFTATDELQKVPAVRINEVSASNEIYQNEYFKQNDWLELYNTTDQAIDIAGMYLSDDSTKLTKFQIPSNFTSLTTIPAHGYRIIWCDKLVTSTELHASFKLASEGEIYICKGTNVNALDWVDGFKYTAHGSDRTYGRYPDGANKQYVFSRPSFNSSNIYSPYNVLIQEGTLPTVGIEEVLTSDQNCSIYYDSNAKQINVLITNESNPPKANLYIVNTLGQIQLQRTLSAGETSHTIAIESLATGCYIASVQHANGLITTTKFVVTE
ncbi:MAG: CotH kinase family protein [Bacteroidaceae bacterium]